MVSLVISGGRVVDPASGMDAVGDVAVVDGQIAAVGTGLGGAERVIDATGLVVAPGFIDLHAHGQSIPADRMQAFDGVTTTLDLEAGVLPVASWYRRQAAKGRVLNYGAAANWAFARIGAMTGSNAESSLEAFGNAMRDRRWIDNVASDTEVAGILDRLAIGLNEGGIGIGILNAYAPGAGVQELTAVCQLAAAHDVATFTHVAYMSRIDPESAAEASFPLVGGAIASDAMPWTLSDGSPYTGDAWPLPDDATSHPRSAGCFTRFIREWVRERKKLSLVEGVRKCALIPAEILSHSTPAMRAKGRLQPGADADIVVFDFDDLTDRATFSAMNCPSKGVRHLVVSGHPLISDGVLDVAARPGRPVRRPVAER